MSSRAGHCLRPEFTDSLATRLLAGESLILISPHGQGRRRTLADLRDSLPKTRLIIQINMSTHITDYKGFIDQFVQECRHQASVITSLNNVLELLEKRHEQVVIILHNFDEIRNREAVSSGYSATLFKELNSIRQRSNISLLCVCEQGFDNYLLQSDGTELPGSELNSETVRLPDLTAEQIELELRQRQLNLTDGEMPALCEWLLKQSAPYSSLDKCNADWIRQKLWQQH